MFIAVIISVKIAFCSRVGVHKSLRKSFQEERKGQNYAAYHEQHLQVHLADKAIRPDHPQREGNDETNEWGGHDMEC